MTITREKPCTGIDRTLKLRRDAGYQNRFHAVTGLEDKYRNTRQVRHAKSVRSAATEFLNPKKEWSIIISCPAINQDLERDFHKLAEQWHDETRFHSSLSKKFMHPAYQTIMAMGDKALPLILTELQKAPGHWFYALRFIARKDIAERAKGFEDARSIWLEWGRKNRLI